MIRSRLCNAAALLACLVSSAMPALAQDPAVVNAALVTVKLDNERVRVFETVLKPGEKEALHAHPAYVIYVLEGGTMRNHGADGKVSDAKLEAGQTLYREPLTHWAENVGDSTIRVLVTELKQAARNAPR